MATMIPHLDDVTIREFDAADDAACKELEVSASQFIILHGSIRLALLHYHRFDRKLHYFQRESFVLVAEAEQRICGVVAVAIKRAWMHGAQRLCGFVFDLRVDPSRQRQGIGRSLTQEVETRCIARGVEFLYLSVNGDNQKAQRLYSRVGMTTASSRVLDIQVLLLPAWPWSVLSGASDTMRALPASEASELLWQHFGKRDLGLDRAGYEALCTSDLFLGCWMLSDRDGSFASLSLWNGSELAGFAVFVMSVKLVLPIPGSRWYCALVIGTMALLAPFALSRLPSPFLIASLALLGVLGTLANWCSTRKAFRARVIAPVYGGPNWQPLMRALHERLKGEVRRPFGGSALKQPSPSPTQSIPPERPSLAPAYPHAPTTGLYAIGVPLITGTCTRLHMLGSQRGCGLTAASRHWLGQTAGHNNILAKVLVRHNGHRRLSKGVELSWAARACGRCIFRPSRHVRTFRWQRPRVVLR